MLIEEYIQLANLVANIEAYIQPGDELSMRVSIADITDVSTRGGRWNVLSEKGYHTFQNKEALLQHYFSLTKQGKVKQDMEQALS